MGQKNSNNSNNTKDNIESNSAKKKENNSNKVNINLQRNSFDFLYVIGKGGFGKVKIFDFNENRFGKFIRKN